MKQAINNTSFLLLLALTSPILIIIFSLFVVLFLIIYPFEYFLYSKLPFYNPLCIITHRKEIKTIKKFKKVPYKYFNNLLVYDSLEIVFVFKNCKIKEFSNYEIININKLSDLKTLKI